jgi:hypothetical protein
MEKEFVPYEQALALKELGFDEPCYGNYNNLTETTRFIFGKTNEGSITWNRVPGTNDIVISNERILAPTYSQAFRFFREKYGLEASIQRMPPEVYGKGKGDIKKYLLYIWAENLNPRGQQTLHFDTYEEAELECLKKLIEITKKV